MPSPFDFAANPTPSTRSLNVTDLIRNYTNLIKSLPRQEEDIIIQGFRLQTELDIHDFELITGTPEDVIQDEFVDHVDPVAYHVSIPAVVHSDPLVYDNSNASGVTFPTPDAGIGNKFAGAVVTPGNKYMIINDDPVLKPSDKITIACQVYIPTSPTPTSHHLISKIDATNGYLIDYNNTNITFGIVTATGFAQLALPYPKDVWFSIVFSYSSTFGIRGKINNGTLFSNTSKTGAISHTAVRLTIFADRTGTFNATSGTAIAWLVMLHGEVLAATSWTTDYENGIIDKNTVTNSNFEEITTIPYLGDLEAQTNMTSGLFVSS